MDPAAAQYIQAIDPRHRPLFDRLHHLILARYPGVTVWVGRHVRAMTRPPPE